MEGPWFAPFRFARYVVEGGFGPLGVLRYFSVLARLCWIFVPVDRAESWSVTGPGEFSGVEWVAHADWGDFVTVADSGFVLIEVGLFGVWRCWVDSDRWLFVFFGVF